MAWGQPRPIDVTASDLAADPDAIKQLILHHLAPGLGCIIAFIMYVGTHSTTECRGKHARTATGQEGRVLAKADSGRARAPAGSSPH